MAFVSLHALEKTYPDGTRAVRGVDLEIGQGQFVVLLGPSGCGKTTTLRMIAGLELPTAGSVVIDGTDVTRLPPSARDVGFVFQLYALYPHLTVRENIEFPLCAMGMRPSERRAHVRSVSERVGLAGLLGRFPRELSGGDAQRVALARAMVRRPAIYLMDEPLGTLDADCRVKMREFIREQQLALGVTTVYVTHDQEEAMSLADLVVVMRDGRIHQAGPPSEVYERPADRFVAAFVGSPGMSLLEGEVRRSPAPSFVSGDIALPLPSELPCGEGRATLGVRPEYVRVDDAGPLRGQVVFDEYLGSHHNVHVETERGRLVLRSSEPLAIGAVVRLALDMDHARVFT
jgi:multiple sugar transport system ATP-binding protein